MKTKVSTAKSAFLYFKLQKCSVSVPVSTQEAVPSYLPGGLSLPETQAQGAIHFFLFFELKKEF